MQVSEGIDFSDDNARVVVSLFLHINLLFALSFFLWGRDLGLPYGHAIFCEDWKMVYSKIIEIRVNYYCWERVQIVACLYWVWLQTFQLLIIIVNISYWMYVLDNLRLLLVFRFPTCKNPFFSLLIFLEGSILLWQYISLIA